MKTTIKTLALLLTLTLTAQAYAQDFCDGMDLEKCKEAVTAEIARQKVAEATVQFSKVVSIADLTHEQMQTFCSAAGKDGSCLMKQEVAAVFCTGLNAHLPSIREYAQFSQNQGSKGILPEAKGKNDKDAILIISRDLTNKKLDQFYYSAKNYSSPVGFAVVDGNNVWTASYFPSTEGYAIGFSLLLGKIIYASRAKPASLAVRCILN